MANPSLAQEPLLPEGPVRGFPGHTLVVRNTCVGLGSASVDDTVVLSPESQQQLVLCHISQRHWAWWNCERCHGPCFQSEHIFKLWLWNGPAAEGKNKHQKISWEAFNCFSFLSLPSLPFPPKNNNCNNCCFFFFFLTKSKRWEKQVLPYSSSCVLFTAHFVYAVFIFITCFIANLAVCRCDPKKLHTTKALAAVHIQFKSG